MSQKARAPSDDSAVPAALQQATLPVVAIGAVTVSNVHTKTCWEEVFFRFSPLHIHGRGHL
jgi:hypothetical protein